ncbi:uncharacterized protein [Centruroides vittatus]|uniref:uncharacterized protein n=1 Tax=Centruroides vittatus TaxID=120091 RepID=UPI00350F9E64
MMLTIFLLNLVTISLFSEACSYEELKKYRFCSLKRYEFLRLLKPRSNYTRLDLKFSAYDTHFRVIARPTENSVIDRDGTVHIHYKNKAAVDKLDNFRIKFYSGWLLGHPNASVLGIFNGQVFQSIIHMAEETYILEPCPNNLKITDYNAIIYRRTDVISEYINKFVYSERWKSHSKNLKIGWSKNFNRINKHNTEIIVDVSVFNNLNRNLVSLLKHVIFHSILTDRVFGKQDIGRNDNKSLKLSKLTLFTSMKCQLYPSKAIDKYDIDNTANTKTIALSLNIFNKYKVPSASRALFVDKFSIYYSSCIIYASRSVCKRDDRQCFAGVVESLSHGNERLLSKFIRCLNRYRPHNRHERNKIRPRSKFCTRYCSKLQKSSSVKRCNSREPHKEWCSKQETKKCKRTNVNNCRVYKSKNICDFFYFYIEHKYINSFGKKSKRLFTNITQFDLKEKSPLKKEIGSSKLKRFAYFCIYSFLVCIMIYGKSQKMKMVQRKIYRDFQRETTLNEVKIDNPNYERCVWRLVTLFPTVPIEVIRKMLDELYHEELVVVSIISNGIPMRTDYSTTVSLPLLRNYDLNSGISPLSKDRTYCKSLNKALSIKLMLSEKETKI